MSVRHCDLTVGLRVRGTEFHFVRTPVANRRSMETAEWAILDFDAPEPVSFNAFDTISKDMQDLLTLSAYAPCGALAQSLIFRTSDTHPGPRETSEVEVLGPQVYRTEKATKDSGHHLYLLTLADLDFPDLAPRWLALKQAARLGFNILFGLRYISSGYVGTRLLGAAAAAESIHRGLCHASTPLPRREYANLKKALLAAIADEPEHIRDFVKRGLRNDPTYNERMLELASIPDPEAAGRLLTDPSAWAARLKNARNDLAHANERSADETGSAAAHWLLEVTYALLCLVAIAKLGLSPEIQRRAIENPAIDHASREVRKLLQTPEHQQAEAC